MTAARVNQRYRTSEDGENITQNCSFKNYYETMAFANTAATISHDQEQHPKMTIGHRDCRLSHTMFAISGLSHNDFICAAKTDRLTLE